MGARLWMILALMDAAASSLHPQQLSRCRVNDTAVYCNGMNLEAVPDELPPDVRKLDLSQNLLQNLTHGLLAAFAAVSHLNLRANKIQFIQPHLFKDMTNLQELDLSKNDLEAFALQKSDVGPLTAVRRLDLSSNGLYTGMSDYFLREAPALTSLSLASNSITKINKDTFAGSSALRSIDLQNNVILEIEEDAFDALQDLSDLNLSTNSITCIADFNLHRLRSLNLSKNSLELFEAEVETDVEYQLRYLDLRENKIHYFPVLPCRNRLIFLDLSRNRLMSVNTNGTAEEEAAGHQNLSELLYLDLSHNQIHALPAAFFQCMQKLETLNVSSNCLRDFGVSGDVPMHSLRTLDLSFNKLRNVSFGEDTLRALESLYLQGNYLSRLDPDIFRRLPQIRELHLQRNDLSVCAHEGGDEPPGCVSLSSIRTLNYLYYSKSSPASVPAHAFRGSPLLLLDLSGNPSLQIDALAFSGLETSLTRLSLKENDLRSLDADLYFLTYLDLSFNKLTAVPLWNKESSIEVLNLQGNSLVTLEEDTVSTLGQRLKTLYLSSNPFNCCSNSWLPALVQEFKVDIADIDAVTCAYERDSELGQIDIRGASQEPCQTLNNSRLAVIVIVATLLGLIVVVMLLLKLCHSKRCRLNDSFKA
ncbi:transforming growth factor beta activator LRRC32 isoform X2 [Denticeps clupeoides]|nr:transforming growth factor beta activator LRRC32-like isoform X2 [Denticeps clupeoides]XP_028824933.1 transforming growth factor beta activator LRRC32-like isoform X2 [Denticeps clupeoides]XP_028824934.1 transforming growth factor beta activator LRRC32-like isoform X2 [Denticeps clupeoides]XP_028840609.1 transforming growth factor beta activator LRRC32-like isoform X2 [Denticeps clupeoides]XP_028840610.1 transforming growth factor beta activator LRRC32-like isoform X2 [Denticeps clupeoides]